MQQSCSHSNAICTRRFKKRIELRTHTHNHSMQNTEEEPIELETIQTATAAHTRYFSSSLAATLHEKIQGFVLRLPPHNIAHATFMQPFQCDLQPEIQEMHRTTHTGTTTCCKTQRRNQNDRSRNRRTQEVPFIVGRSLAHATVMQPFQCDLQPEIQETHRTTHTGTTTCCKTQRRNQNDRSHNRRTQEVPFIVGCSHLYMEKHKVSRSGFLPTT